MRECQAFWKFYGKGAEKGKRAKRLRNEGGREGGRDDERKGRINYEKESVSGYSPALRMMLVAFS